MSSTAATPALFSIMAWWVGVWADLKQRSGLSQPSAPPGARHVTSHGIYEVPLHGVPVVIQALTSACTSYHRHLQRRGRHVCITIRSNSHIH